jgi:hypothetical protein
MFTRPFVRLTGVSAIVLGFILTANLPGMAAAEPVVATIGDVIAVDQNDAIRIEVAMRIIPARPRISLLSDPPRIVLDFIGAVPEGGYRRINVNKHSVASIRIALFRQGIEGNPSVTRIVVDLEKDAKYEAFSESNKFVLKVFDQLANPASKQHPNVSSQVHLSDTKVPPTSAMLSKGSVVENKLNDIQVSQIDGTTNVVLTFERPTEPRSMTLTDPARFVMDFPGAIQGTVLKQLNNIAKDSIVRSVRMSSFTKQPEVLRVVLDEKHGAGPPDVTVEGSRVLVKYAKTSPAPNESASIAPTPTVSRPFTPAAGSLTNQITHPGAARKASASAAKTSEPRGVMQGIPAKSGRSGRQAQATVAASNGELGTARALTGPGTQSAAVSGVVAQIPIVTYNNGLLTIDVQNATLTDVLYLIGEKTGAKIELPFSEGMLDRIVFKAGPGRPREVLATMLEGTAYNYYIVENSNGGLDTVVLAPK